MRCACTDEVRHGQAKPVSMGARAHPKGSRWHPHPPCPMKPGPECTPQWPREAAPWSPWPTKVKKTSDEKRRRDGPPKDGGERMGWASSRNERGGRLEKRVEKQRNRKKTTEKGRQCHVISRKNEQAIRRKSNVDDCPSSHVSKGMRRTSHRGIPAASSH